MKETVCFALATRGAGPGPSVLAVLVAYHLEPMLIKVNCRLGAVYNAGYFSMSTWIPFIWGWINVLVLIISSFTMQGGL